MKLDPVYSISDLCELLGESPWWIRDAFVGMKIRAIHAGRTADLSKWQNPRTVRPDGSIFVVTGVTLTPPPSEVLVSIEDLPDIWKERIVKSRLRPMSTSSLRAKKAADASHTRDRYASSTAVRMYLDGDIIDKNKAAKKIGPMVHLSWTTVRKKLQGLKHPSA